MNTTLVRDAQTSATLTRGEHLQELLEDAVLKHLMKDPAKSVTILLQQPNSRAIQVAVQILLTCKSSSNDFNR